MSEWKVTGLTPDTINSKNIKSDDDNPQWKVTGYTPKTLPQHTAGGTHFTKVTPHTAETYSSAVSPILQKAQNKETLTRSEIQKLSDISLQAKNDKSLPDDIRNQYANLFGIAEEYKADLSEKARNKYQNKQEHIKKMIINADRQRTADSISLKEQANSDKTLLDYATNITKGNAYINDLQLEDISADALKYAIANYGNEKAIKAKYIELMPQATVSEQKVKSGKALTKEEKHNLEEFKILKTALEGAPTTTGDLVNSIALGGTGRIANTIVATGDFLANVIPRLFGKNDIVDNSDSIKAIQKEMSRAQQTAVNFGKQKLNNGIISKTVNNITGADAGGMLGSIMYDVGSNMIAQIPTIALAFLSGGSSSASSLASGSTKAMQYISSLIKNPMFWTAASEEFASSYSDSYIRGENMNLAALKALTVGAINGAIEIGFGVESRIGKSADELSESVWKAILDSAKEEGLEEGVQGGVSTFFDFLFGVATDNAAGDKYAYSKPKELLINSLKEMGIGALSGVIMSGGTQTLQSVINTDSSVQIKKLGERAIKSNNAEMLISWAKNFGDEYTIDIAESGDVKNDAYKLGRLQIALYEDIHNSFALENTTKENLTENLQKFANILKPTNTIYTSVVIPQFTAAMNEIGIAPQEIAKSITDVYEATVKNTALSKEQSQNSEIAVDYNSESGDVLPENDDTISGDDVSETDEGANANENKSEIDDNDGVVFHEPDNVNDVYRHIEKTAKALDPDLRVVFLDKLHRAGKVNETVTGKYDRKRNTIYIKKGISASEMYVEIFKHEFMHSLETRKLYDEFKNYLYNKSKAFESYARLEIRYETGEEFTGSKKAAIEKLSEIYVEMGYAKQDVPYETVANFFADCLLKGKSGRSEIANALGSDGILIPDIEASEQLDILSELAENEPTLLQRIKDFFKKLLRKIKGQPAFRNLEADLTYLDGYIQKLYDSRKTKNTAESGEVKYSIGVLENGNTFVIHDRNVITATDTNGMRKQITAFFNELLNEKESIDIPTLSGDVLTITKSETANKARDNYKTENGRRIKLSTEEFAIKSRAESHIDELAETSDAFSYSSDKKSHSFAKNGFTYRTAYFEDYDGQYYKITLSVGNNNNTATIYNIGNIKEDKLPSAKLIAVVGSKPLGNKSSVSSISENTENVNINSSTNNSNEKYSLSPEHLRYNPEKYMHWLLRHFHVPSGAGYVEEFTPRLEEIVKLYNKGGAANIEDAEYKLNKLTMDMAESMPDILTEMSSELLSDLKKTAVSLSETQKDEILYKYKTINSFKTEIGIKISDDAIPLDSQWQEWAEMYPAYFKTDVPEGDMPSRLAEIIYNAKGDFYPRDDEYVANQIANEIMHTIRTTGKRSENQRISNAIKYGYSIGYEAANRNSPGYIKANTERLIKHSLRNINHIDSLLYANQNQKHVPEELKSLMHSFMSVFITNDDTAVFNSSKDINRRKAFYDNQAFNVESADDTLKARERAVKNFINEFKVYLQENDIDENYSEIIKLNIIGFEAFAANARVSKYTEAQAEILYNISEFLNKAVNEKNTAFINGKKVEMKLLGEKAIVELEKMNPLKLFDTLGVSGAESFRQMLVEGNLPPYYVFKRLGKTFENLYWDLIEGQNKTAILLNEASDVIQKIKDENNFSAWKDDVKKVMIGGKTYALTVGQLQVIYATKMREMNNDIQKSKHTRIGGIVFDRADIKNTVKGFKKGLKKGSKSESAAEKLISTTMNNLGQGQ